METNGGLGKPSRFVLNTRFCQKSIDNWRSEVSNELIVLLAFVIAFLFLSVFYYLMLKVLYDADKNAYKIVVFRQKNTRNIYWITTRFNQYFQYVIIILTGVILRLITNNILTHATIGVFLGLTLRWFISVFSLNQTLKKLNFS